MIAATIMSTKTLGGGGGGPIAPSAVFGLSDFNFLRGQTVYFYDHSTGAPTSWSWTVNGQQYSTQQNPTFYCQNLGVYAVILTVSNAFGSSASSPQIFQVVNQLP